MIPPPSDDQTALRNAGLRRMLEAHRPVPPPRRDHTPVLEAAWSRALRHAAAPMPALGLRVQACAVEQDTALAPVLEALPPHGLVALIESDGAGSGSGPGRTSAAARGLIFIAHPLLDALIEVQTTGRVEARLHPPRRLTGIDQALSRDFIDLALASFAREVGEASVPWPKRMSFGTAILDRSQLSLLLPKGLYHHLTAQIDLGVGAMEGSDVGDSPTPRPATATLLLPAMPSPEETPDADAAKAPDAPAFGAALRKAVAGAAVRVDAILLRQARPLAFVRRLAVGDLLHFDPGDLDRVTLEIAGGHAVASGTLGRINGRRAVRLTAPDPAASSAKGSAPDAAPDADPHPPPPDPPTADLPPARAEPAVPAPPIPPPTDPTAAPSDLAAARVPAPL